MILNIIKEENNEYIYFGSFPQTVKEDNISVSIKKDKKGYRLGSDNEKYARLKATPFDSFYLKTAKFKNGQKIEKSKKYYFKVEPIKWRILKRNTNELLLVADKILCARMFDPEVTDYENSQIRKWLISNFFNQAFSSEEKELLKERLIPNSREYTIDQLIVTEYYSDGYVNTYDMFDQKKRVFTHDTYDKVFLLGMSDLLDNGNLSPKTIDEQIKLQREFTDYARCMGVDTLFEDYGKYYLRTNCSGNDIETVSYSGNTYHASNDSTNIGVLPGIVIKIDDTVCVNEIAGKPKFTIIDLLLNNGISSENQEKDIETLLLNTSAKIIEQKSKEIYVHFEKLEHSQKGDIVEFGSCPQTVKAKEVHVFEYPNKKSFGIGSDLEQYYRAKARPEKMCTLSNGELITCHTNTPVYFKLEPIKWRVLDATDDKVLLCSETILYSHNFDKESTDYSASSIRKWLNEPFYNEAFTKFEKSLILEEPINNEKMIKKLFKHKIISTATLNDKVFLLSTEELKKYDSNFEKNEDLIKKVTDYAKINDVDVESGTDNGRYWLRTPTKIEKCVCTIPSAKREVLGKSHIDWKRCGVAPAIWVKRTPIKKDN